MNEPNIIYIISKIKEKVSGSDWAPILNPWLDSTDHYNVVKALKSANESGVRFTPRYGDAYNAFHLAVVRKGTLKLLYAIYLMHLIHQMQTLI